MAINYSYSNISSLGLDDRLLVIDVSESNATKLASISNIVSVAKANISLQDVLNVNNTATQDINLIGQIDVTNILAGSITVDGGLFTANGAANFNGLTTIQNVSIVNGNATLENANILNSLGVNGDADFQTASFNNNVTFYNPTEFQDVIIVPEIQFANPAISGEKLLKWNDTDGTLDVGLKGGNVTLQIGQEQVIRVVNGTGAELLQSQYRAVKIIGAQGQRLQVGLAQADSDINSATTIGLVTETIANNQQGFITTEGAINDINTTGSLQGETWVDGDVLYLSPTIPGALTNVKPITPAHLIVVGFVEYAHANNGKIYIKIDNGYELDELHDVKITTPTGNQLLAYNASTGFWRNIGLGQIGGVTTVSPGVSNYVTKFNSSSTISPSVLIFDNGTGVGIDTTTINEILNVQGKLALNNAANSISIGVNTGGTGNQCIAIGSSALSLGTAGNNIALGFRAMQASTTANANIAIGVEAMQSNTTGNENSVIGYRAMQANTTGIRNVAIGREALKFNTTGARNTAIGHQSLFNSVLINDIVAVGYQSLFSNTTGARNTANGKSSLFSNTTGQSNTAVGYESLFSNTTGKNNSAIGSGALYNNTTGEDNTAIGLNALSGNTTGNNNTAVGTAALSDNIEGASNIAIGKQAGQSTSSFASNAAPGSSIFIGSGTRAKNANDTNQIVIGVSAFGNGSNTATIGSTALTALHVGGNGAGLVLKSPNGTSYKITVDNSGNLVTTAI